MFKGVVRAVQIHGSTLRNAILNRVCVVEPSVRSNIIVRQESASPNLEEHGFESATISDILKAKGKSADGSWLWCGTDDTVYDAVQSVSMNIKLLVCHSEINLMFFGPC